MIKIYVCLIFIVHQTENITIFSDFYQYYLEFILNHYFILTSISYPTYTHRETSLCRFILNTSSHYPLVGRSLWGRTWWLHDKIKRFRVSRNDICISIHGAFGEIPIDKALLKYAHIPRCYVYETVIISNWMHFVEFMKMLWLMQMKKNANEKIHRNCICSDISYDETTRFSHTHGGQCTAVLMCCRKLVTVS